MSSNPVEKLYTVIRDLLALKLPGTIKMKWNELGGKEKDMFDVIINGGIKRDDVTFTVKKLGVKTLYLAEYYDSSMDFSAEYLAYNNEIIYVREN